MSPSPRSSFPQLVSCSKSLWLQQPAEHWALSFGPGWDREREGRDRDTTGSRRLLLVSFFSNQPCFPSTFLLGGGRFPSFFWTENGRETGLLSPGLLARKSRARLHPYSLGSSRHWHLARARISPCLIPLGANFSLVSIFIQKFNCMSVCEGLSLQPRSGAVCARLSKTTGGSTKQFTRLRQSGSPPVYAGGSISSSFTLLSSSLLLSSHPPPPPFK